MKNIIEKENIHIFIKNREAIFNVFRNIDDVKRCKECIVESIKSLERLESGDSRATCYIFTDTNNHEWWYRVDYTVKFCNGIKIKIINVKIDSITLFRQHYLNVRL